MSVMELDRASDTAATRERLLRVLLERGMDAPDDVLVPPSHEQQRMWFAERLQGAAGAYNLCNSIPVPDGVPVSLLARCFEYLLARHDVMRGRFVERDGAPMLQVLSLQDSGFAVERIPAGELPHDVHVLQVLEAERTHVFDLAGECLVRVLWVENPQGGGTLVVNVHHIVTDTWSLAHFTEEFGRVFEALAEDREPDLEPMQARYGDYGLWQRHWMRGSDAQAQLDYWRRHLLGAKALDLPISQPRPSEKRWEGGTIRLPLTAGLIAQLDAMQRRLGLTRFAVLCAGVAITLHGLGGPDDVVLGSSVSTRRESVLEPVFGLFLNQVAMRFRMGANPSIDDFVRQSAQVARDALMHRELPFGQVVAALGQDRDPSRSPLFDALVSLQNTPRSAILGNVFVNDHLPEIGSAKFDLSFFFEEERGTLTGRLVYGKALFSAEAARRIVDFLEQTLLALPASGEQTISQFISQRASRNRMNTTPIESPVASRFKRAERKAINLSDLRAVEERASTAGRPHVYEARESGIDALAWIGENRDAIAEKRRVHGAVLLRGLQLDAIATFDRVLQVMCDRVIAGYGDLPEEKGTDRIYGSTPYPNDRRILFHSESSHMASWPLHQFFACVTASPTGGETPIVDVRRIHDALDDALRERFRSQGLSYIRHFIPGLDVPWQAFFKTTSTAEVEAICARNGAQCAWKHDGILMVRQPSHAVARHPVTGAWSFFNQIMLHHSYFLLEEERAALVSLYGEDNLPRMVTYGDGSQIGDDVLAMLLGLYEEHQVAFPWQSGDLLLLDNMSVAHARNPFSGPRKIIVGMGDPVTADGFMD